MPGSTSKLSTQKEGLWVCLRITLAGGGGGGGVENTRKQVGQELIVVAAGWRVMGMDYTLLSTFADVWEFL